MIKIFFLLFFLGLFYYSVIFEPYNIKIERQKISIKDLPSAFEGVKIVHLSDLHSRWFSYQEKKVLKILEELKPDFIFITGDFIDLLTTKLIDKDLNSVKIFWQKLGEKYQNRVFSVLGNHDNDDELVKRYLRESGIVILENENQKLLFNGEYIYLIGVADPWTAQDNLGKAIEGINEDRPKILLAHAAEIIDEAAEKNIDLVLAGHTHGGQINIPYLEKIQPLIPYLGKIQLLSEHGQKYTNGLFKINSGIDNKFKKSYTYLYVNRGVGTSLLPIRFNCPPEITLIELKKN